MLCETHRKSEASGKNTEERTGAENNPDFYNALKRTRSFLTVSCLRSITFHCLTGLNEELSLCALRQNYGQQAVSLNRPLTFLTLLASQKLEYGREHKTPQKAFKCFKKASYNFGGNYYPTIIFCLAKIFIFFFKKKV